MQISTALTSALAVSLSLSLSAIHLDVASTAECTTAELAQVDVLDAVISAAPECAAIGDKELDQVSDVELCAATKCLEVIKSTVLKTPSCTEDGVSSVEFIQLLIDSCTNLTGSKSTITTAPGSASNSSTATTAPSLTPTPTTVAPKANTTTSGNNATTSAPEAATPTPKSSSSAGISAVLKSALLATSLLVVLTYAL